VFRRDGDRWRAMHEHLSPYPAPDEPAAAGPGDAVP
jgi:ketosteroid isomerase-like protein